MPIFYGFSCFFLQKWDFVESWDFLRYNQCIKTLHLIYQMTLSDDFHFSPYKACFQTPGREGKNSVLEFFFLNNFILMHKTTPKNIRGSNVSPVLRKMEKLVPPPIHVPLKADPHLENDVADDKAGPLVCLQLNRISVLQYFFETAGSMDHQHELREPFFLKKFLPQWLHCSGKQGRVASGR